jgi:hypothetical protein
VGRLSIYANNRVTQPRRPAKSILTLSYRQVNVFASQRSRSLHDHRGDEKMGDENVQACLDLITGKQKAEHVQSVLLKEDGDVEAVLWTAWSDIIKAAEQVEESQQSVLVDLLSGLKKHDVCSKGREARLWDMDYTEDQLPLFGASMRENLDIGKFTQFSERVSSEPLSSAHKDLQTFTRFCSFSAQVTQADVQDLTLHGVWVLREALEDLPVSEIVSKPDNGLTAISGACAWLTYAHSALMRDCRAKRSFEGRMARHGAAIADDALPDGLTMERWNLWRQRAEAIHKDANASQTLRSYTQRIISSLS